MKPHGFTYFNRIEKAWREIPGPCYLVSLPITLQIPALRDEQLIVHHTINTLERWKEKHWTVTHRMTSGVVAYGRTRAEALANAQEKLLTVGNEKFLRAIRFLQDQLDSMK